MNATSQVNTAQLLRILDCLIDTAERTTDLKAVYNDRNSTSVDWDEILAFRENLKSSAPAVLVNKLELIKHVATEGGKLQQTILDALPDKSPMQAGVIRQKFADINEFMQSAQVQFDNKQSLKINALIEGCTLHDDKIVEWVIIYLLKNPKTNFEDALFNEGFNEAFPKEEPDTLINTLETLYRQGIANKYAICEYYIDDTSISTIDGRRKIIAFQGLDDNTPIWDFKR
jgi:hypothetical protein